jgi:hypothetical protein
MAQQQKKIESTEPTDGAAHMPGLTVRRVSLDDIHPDPGNVNTHDARNMQAIVASLKTFGQVEPLVVQKGTGKVIGGNGRLEAMRSIGWTECDIVEIDASNVMTAALGIALNRTAKTSVFDDEALVKTLEAIRSEPDFPIEATGFDDSEIDALLESITADHAGALDDDGGTSGGDSDSPGKSPNASLAERFGVPPFSVLDARQGYWQDRKRAWLALGIQSELGRGGGC